MGALETAQVIIPRPFSHPFTYEIPEELKGRVSFGSVVVVPFGRGNSEILGFVVGVGGEIKEAGSEKKTHELKKIKEAPFDRPVFSQKDFSFYQWIAEYYQLPLGEVFYSSFPKAVFKVNKRKTAVKELEEFLISSTTAPIKLTVDQEAALKEVSASIESGKFKSFLLFGVTGSGKTEVYLQAAKKALESVENSVLILVPEIALTPQLKKRFEDRFGNQVAVLHSNLTEKQRKEYWWDILESKRRVIVGARSALFAPIQNLGLVVVDEEHETSYKQEDRLRYNARDLALVRARQHQATVVLGSATPSIETYFNAQNGKHELLRLRTRPAERPMPHIEIVNLNGEDKKKFFEGGLLSPRLMAGLHETLSKNEQAIIFVNRKGFSNFLMCRDCGHVPRCLNCSVALTYYLHSRELKCHYCGLKMQATDHCEKCKSHELKHMGFGTEQIEKYLQENLPGIKVGRLDADVVSTAKKLDAILEDFRSGETQVLVGTQMLAKGHDFPNVTFIGVVLADQNLHLPDFRSGERTFQLIAQVSGRAGRGDKPGRVILQTFLPDHYIIQTASQQDYEAFYKEEIQQRAVFAYPPFTKLAQIEFRHLKEDVARQDALHAKNLLEKMLQLPENGSKVQFDFLGPAAASISRVANQYRWHLLLKSEKSSDLNAVIKTLRKEGVRFIDVDPVSTL